MIVDVVAGSVGLIAGVFFNVRARYRIKRYTSQQAEIIKWQTMHKIAAEEYHKASQYAGRMRDQGHKSDQQVRMLIMDLARAKRELAELKAGTV